MHIYEDVKSSLVTWQVSIMISRDGSIDRCRGRSKRFAKRFRKGKEKKERKEKEKSLLPL